MGIEKHLEEIFIEFSSSVEDKKLFFGENIPEKKLKNAVSAYAPSAKTVYILCDNTVFGNAKNGFLLTDTTLYTCESHPLEINLDLIKSVDLEMGMLEKKIVINNQLPIIFTQPDKDTIQAIAKMFMRIASYNNSVEKFGEENESSATESSTINCIGCGSEIPQNSKFCGECGTKVISEIICNNCNISYSAGTKFCSECGQNLFEMSDQQQSKQEESDMKQETLNLTSDESNMETKLVDASLTQGDDNKRKIIKLTIINAGGEFTGGFVTDSDVKENLREKIESGSVNSSMDFDDGTDFETSSYVDIFHQYGPNVPGATIQLDETTDIEEDEYSRSYEEYFSEDIDETEIKQFSSSNPDLYDLDKSNYSYDDLVIFSQKIEKRIHYPVLFEVDKKEDVVLSNIYIGSMNMDETISSDEIIEDFLYITKDKAIEYTKEYLKDNYNNDDLLVDYISDIYRGEHELKEKIRNNHLMLHEDIEGKGEWEDDYVKVTDLSGEILFESGGAFESGGGDLESVWDFSNKAKELIAEGDSEAAREYIVQGISIAEDSSDLVTLAEVACSSDDDEGLADKEWGRQLFEQAEGKADGLWDIKNIAEEVSQENLLDDKKWATNLLKQLEKDAENADQLLDIADSVGSSLEDNEWVLSLYKKAEAAEEVASSDFRRLANSVAQLDDEDWAKSLYEKSFDTAEDSSDLLSLAEALKDDFDNRKWADNVIEAAIEKSGNVSELLQCAQTLGWEFEDKNKARSIYEQAIEKADDVDEYREIAESMIDEDYLGDNDWAQSLADEHGFDLD